MDQMLMLSGRKQESQLITTPEVGDAVMVFLNVHTKSLINQGHLERESAPEITDFLANPDSPEYHLLRE